jgi:hypothetical protein
MNPLVKTVQEILKAIPPEQRRKLTLPEVRKAERLIKKQIRSLGIRDE